MTALERQLRDHASHIKRLNQKLENARLEAERVARVHKDEIERARQANHQKGVRSGRLDIRADFISQKQSLREREHGQETGRPGRSDGRAC